MKVVHCQREPYTHYIGRGPKDIGLGNPYTYKGSNVPGMKQVSTLTAALEAFEDYAHMSPHVLALIKQLPADAVLGCWCHREDWCHGGIIIRLWHEMHPTP